MTIEEQNRYQPLPRNGNERIYSFNFDYDNPQWVLVEWGTSEDRELWQTLTLGTDYTITKTFGGGQITLLVDPDSLVDSQGLPFAWLSIRSNYPYSQVYALPNNYSMGAVDLILTYMEIQIQQVWSIAEQILTIPGLWVSFRMVAPPNERGRIPKIDSDNGTMLFKGSALIDDGSKVVSEIDFYANQDTYLRGNTDVSGSLNVNGATTLTGNLTGSNAYFSGNLVVNGTGTFDAIIANSGDIDLIFSSVINNTGDINNTGLLETGSAKINSTLEVTGVSTFASSVTVPDLVGTVSVTAPLLTGSDTVDASKFLILRGTKLYPNFSTLSSGDLLSVSNPTGGSGSNFDLSPRKISGANGIINVASNRIAMGSGQTDPMLPSVIDSDLLQAPDTISVSTKHFQVDLGSMYLPSGLISLAGTMLKVDLSASLVGQYLTLAAPIPGEESLYKFILKSAVVSGGGGGGSIGNVSLNTFSIGDGAGTLKDSSMTETADSIAINAKNLLLSSGALDLISGDIALGGLKLRSELANTAAPGLFLSLASPNPGEENDYDYLLTSTVGGGGSGGSSQVNENVFAMGGVAGSGTLVNAPVALQNTDIVSQTGWSFKSDTLKCDLLKLNPSGFYLNMGYDPQSNSKNINATWKINLDWMTAGDFKGISLRKIDDENCVIFPLAESPPTPTTPGQTWVANSVASFAGWDPYQEKQITGNKVAVVHDDVVENWDFKVLNAKTTSNSYQTKMPTVSGSDVVLSLNPNDSHTVVVSFSDSITEIQFSEPLIPGTNLVFYFICDSSSKTVNFPSTWYWPGGFNKLVTVAHKMSAVDIYCNSDGEIYAQFLRSGNSFDTGTIRPIPPFTNFGTAKFDTVFGGQMSSSKALVYESSIEKWNFPMAEVKKYSSTKRVLTASNGVLVIPLDGNNSAFEYTHDLDLTSIQISLDSNISSANLAWNLRIITGTSAQRELPIPDGCMSAEDNWTIKEGNAFVSGFWSNTTMFVLPISSFDFKI